MSKAILIKPLDLAQRFSIGLANESAPSNVKSVHSQECYHCIRHTQIFPSVKNLLSKSKEWGSGKEEGPYIGYLLTSTAAVAKEKFQKYFFSSRPGSHKSQAGVLFTYRNLWNTFSMISISLRSRDLISLHSSIECDRVTRQIFGS